jgi:hypothetical protein
MVICIVWCRSLSNLLVGFVDLGGTEKSVGYAQKSHFDHGKRAESVCDFSITLSGK